MRMADPILFAAVGFLFMLLPFASAQQEAGWFAEALTLPSVSRGWRSPIRIDPLEMRIAKGQWTAPAEGEVFLRSDGEPYQRSDGETVQWTRAEANEEGWINAGYALIVLEEERERTALLEAHGHGGVYVNGRFRPGNGYRYGYFRLPVRLKKGRNELLFIGGGRRRGIRARLHPMDAPAMLNQGDMTLPDFVAGERHETHGGVIVMNGEEKTLRGAVLLASIDGGEAAETPVPSVPAVSIRKVPFMMRAESFPDGATEAAVQLTLRVDGAEADSIQFKMRIRKPTESRKRAFISAIDGSVQYYAVQPAQSASGTADALFLSLHGASVEAIGQANAYSSKTWGHLVAPTNRRPFGFDWEDWGRLDAMEVLETARQRLNTDPAKTYLTGHSMGGHGAWHLAVTYPDAFAAVGPSAGWISFRSYTRAPQMDEPDAVMNIMRRAANGSDTIALARNLTDMGVYALHGADDNNVPAREAQRMAEVLTEFHNNWFYHEETGAGHWWNRDDEPGADCVDWAPMFDMFARHIRPENAATRDLQFITANPSVSSQYRWAAIEAQETPMAFSSINLRHDPHRRRFKGTTKNAARIRLDLRHLMPSETIRIEIDGQAIEAERNEAEHLWLIKENDLWTAATDPPSDKLKGPKRYGPFKNAFQRRMIFVYGTSGTDAENEWAYAKARLDAEHFWYRGNGSVEIMSDAEYAAMAPTGRNVILYGNADSNAAWETLFSGSPVQARRGSVSIGERVYEGEETAVLLVRPIENDPEGLAAAVSGTGLTGMRLTNRMPYFVSGVAYPDVFIADAATLENGMEGVKAVGFFGMDWTVETGDFAYR